MLFTRQFALHSCANLHLQEGGLEKTFRFNKDADCEVGAEKITPPCNPFDATVSPERQGEDEPVLGKTSCWSGAP